MKCSRDDIILLLEFTSFWDHEIHIHINFWRFVCKNQGVGMSDYVYWNRRVHEHDEHMNGESIIL